MFKCVLMSRYKARTKESYACCWPSGKVRNSLNGTRLENTFWNVLPNIKSNMVMLQKGKMTINTYRY